MFQSNRLTVLHRNKVVHTDIKPQNIVLYTNDTVNVTELRHGTTFLHRVSLGIAPVYSKLTGAQEILYRPEIRIIDLSTAIGPNDPHSFAAGTRPYRAPESIMRMNNSSAVGEATHNTVPELSWGPEIDCFAVGLVIAEMNIGTPLVPIVDGRHHQLAVLEKILGPFELSFATLVEQSRGGIFIEGTKNIRYLNEGNERLSARAKTLIGRIQQLHPLEVCILKFVKT